MAISWDTYWSDPHTGLYERRATIYDAEDGTDNGEWFSTSGLDYIIVELDESDTCGITISGTNTETAPAASSHGFIIGSEITADGFTSLQGYQLPRWLKIRVTTLSAGTATVRVKIRGRRLGNANE